MPDPLLPLEDPGRLLPLLPLEDPGSLSRVELFDIHFNYLN
jgi:hypothetical protein